LPQGSVKKLSLSILVDHEVRTKALGDKARRIVEAPSAEKLKVIHDLVAAATGWIQPRRSTRRPSVSFRIHSYPESSKLDSPSAPAPVAAPKSKWPPWLTTLMRRNRSSYTVPAADLQSF